MSEVAVTVTPPAPIEVAIATPAPVEVAVTSSVIEIALTAQPAIEVAVTAPAPILVDVAAMGVPGPAGPVELLDSADVPVDPADTYLRFERDLDGDVQAIFLGTVA